jgi:hypothetical protein
MNMKVTTMTGTNFRVTNLFCLLALLLNSRFEFGACSSSVALSRQTQQEPEFIIEDPTFVWDGFRLNIDYQISESIVAEKVTYDVVSDKDCEGGIIEQSEIETSLIEVSETSLRISLLLNPESIHSARYVTHHENYAIIGVCSRLWINKPDDKFEPVTANRDDYIMIKADLDDLDGVEDILEDKAKNWGVQVYRCDENYAKLTQPPALRNGEKLRLCIKPTQKTLNDNVYLGTIKSFHFARDDVLQKSVATYGTDDVTDVLNCDPGSTMCIIESVLKNEFFYSPGEVKAEGVVFLQWGKGEETRKLRVDVNARSLYAWYEQGEIVSEKGGRFNLKVEPMEKTYKAEAFACDSNNKPIQDTSLNSVDRVKMCIQPNEEARDAGVFINNLESFSYGLANDDKVQFAIDSFGRVANERTNANCATGASMCTVDSKLNDWFFAEDATMVATGYVVLQFGDGGNIQRRRAEIVSRDLQTLNFAGRSQVEAFFETIGRGPQVEKRNWFKDLFDEYELSETTLTILYIVAVVIIVLICLCCFAGCILFWFFGWFQRDRKEPSSTPQDIRINIGGRSQSEFQDERSEAPSNYNDDYNPSMSRRGSGSHSNSYGDEPYGHSSGYIAPYSSRRDSQSQRSRRASQSQRSRRTSGSHSSGDDFNYLPGSPVPRHSRRASGSHSRRGSGSHGKGDDDSYMQSPVPSKRQSRRASGSHSRRGSGSHGKGDDDLLLLSPGASRRSRRPSTHSRRGSGSHSKADDEDSHITSSPVPRKSRRPSTHSRRGSGSHEKGDDEDSHITSSPVPRKSRRPSTHSRRGSGSHEKGDDDSLLQSPKPRKSSHSRRGSGSHGKGDDDSLLQSPKPRKSSHSRRGSGSHGKGDDDSLLQSPKPKKSSRRASSSHSRRSSGSHGKGDDDSLMQSPKPRKSRRASGSHGKGDDDSLLQSPKPRKSRRGSGGDDDSLLQSPKSPSKSRRSSTQSRRASGSHRPRIIEEEDEE